MRFEQFIGTGLNRWTQGTYTPGQVEVSLDTDNSFILLSGSYRSGKSEMGARLILRHALTFVGAKVGVFRHHLASLKKSTLRTFLELCNPQWVSSWSNEELMMVFTNGSTVSFLGCEFSDRLGSIEMTYAFLDEAHEISEESKGMIAGRLSGSLGGYSGDYYFGESEGIRRYYLNSLDKRQMLFACNPKSKNHYLYRDFFEKPKPSHKAYTSNSISNLNLPLVYLVNNLSAYVKPGYSREWVIDKVNDIRQGEASPSGLHLRDALTPFGQRNLLGLWVAMEGAIYSTYNSEYHFLAKIPDNWGKPQEFYGAVDWGFNNPRLIVGAMHSDRKLAIVDYWAVSGSTPNKLIDVLERKSDQWGVTRWFLPPDQPGLIKEAKNRIGGSKVKTAKDAVLAGIDSVEKRINRRSLILLNDGSDPSKLADKEMSGYEWARDRDGNYLDKPFKADDHFCLVRDTLVTTERVSVPIQEVRLGDKVLTREGLREVVACTESLSEVKTLVIEFENGVKLQGSLDHPLWVENRGFTKFKDVLSLVKQGKEVVSIGLTSVTLKVSNCYNGKPEKVYNLQVRDTHEYFANGVLVSNCDAIRYLVYSLDYNRKTTPDDNSGEYVREWLES